MHRRVKYSKLIEQVRIDSLCRYLERCRWFILNLVLSPAVADARFEMLRLLSRGMALSRRVTNEQYVRSRSREREKVRRSRKIGSLRFRCNLTRSSAEKSAGLSNSLLVKYLSISKNFRKWTKFSEIREILGIPDRITSFPHFHQSHWSASLLGAYLARDCVS